MVHRVVRFFSVVIVPSKWPRLRPMSQLQRIEDFASRGRLDIFTTSGVDIDPHLRLVQNLYTEEIGADEDQ